MFGSENLNIHFSFHGKNKLIDMKSKIKAILLIILVTMLAISSCKKCFHCYAFQGTIEATKNGHTIYIVYIQWTSLFSDSINYYKSLGYTIDTTSYSFYPDPPNGATSCDTNFAYPALTIRDSCSLIIN